MASIILPLFFCLIVILLCLVFSHVSCLYLALCVMAHIKLGSQNFNQSIYLCSFGIVCPIYLIIGLTHKSSNLSPLLDFQRISACCLIAFVSLPDFPVKTVYTFTFSLSLLVTSLCSSHYRRNPLFLALGLRFMRNNTMQI